MPSEQQVPEELDVLKWDAERFRFLMQLTPHCRVTHKGQPTEHYIVGISWHLTRKYDSLAEFIDAGISEAKKLPETVRQDHQDVHSL